MKDLTPLGKEFYKELSGHTYDEYYSDPAKEIEAKAAAVLCERKMREAIDLAREGGYEGISTYSKWRFDYTKDEVIQKLSNPK